MNVEKTRNEDGDKLTEAFIGCAFKVSNTLGSGFMEKVYENALAIEMTTSALKCEQQQPNLVTYQGFSVGDYDAEILVEGQIILEINAAKVIDNSHQAKRSNYLKATGSYRSLILNFGTTKLGCKRIAF